MITINGVNYEQLNPKASGILPCLDYPCKMVMVGSITIGKGIERGFYYASPHNAFWRLIDEVYQTGGVFSDLKSRLCANFKDFNVGKKNQLSFDNEKKYIIALFRKELIDRQIGICDIFETCYIKQGSTYDKDIYRKKRRGKVEFQYLPTSYIDKILNAYFANKDCKIVVNSCYVAFRLKEYLYDYLQAGKIRIEQYNDICNHIIQVISPSGSLYLSGISEADRLTDWENKL